MTAGLGFRPGGARPRLALVLALAVSLAAVGTGTGQVPPAEPGENPEAREGTGVATLTGSVAVTNPLSIPTLSEPYILLLDLANFVERDINGEPNPDSQILARIEGDLRQGTFAMPLPIAPRGTINDLDREGPGTGVQVYSVELSNNSVGEPFFGPFEAEMGWTTAYSSMRMENGTYEVVGGKIVAWAPDDRQRFPSDFGADGKLFTADDPLAPLPAGWTVVDLDQRPFAQIRTPTVDVPILEGDGGLKDLSALSFTEAFDALVAELRLRYPFTDYKGIDWDAIVAETRPQVEQAERDQELLAFNLAMMRFALRFGDGHLSVRPPVDYLQGRYGGGIGLTLGQADDGTVIVRSVAEGSPAAEAGIEVEAELLEWDGRPIGDAVAAQELFRPASSPHTTALQQLSLLPRREVGTSIAVGYRNPGGEATAATITTVEDREGFRAVFAPPRENPAEPPVTVEVLESGIGYVRVNTFFADLALVAASWEWAIDRMGDLRVSAVIVDVRGNGGGASQLATYLAGSFTAEPFALADLSFADEAGRHVYSGTMDIEPAPVRWGGPVAVLVDDRCASACELFAAAVARDPAHLIVGQYPTAGVEGAVYPWLLPGDLYFQAPLGYLEVDGEVFVEGVGVVPNVDVPVTRESLTSDEDVVLAAAEEALAD